MDSELLRRACEVAGLELTRSRAFDGFAFMSHGRWYQDDDPALPAYVASLLVARVPEDKRGEYSGHLGKDLPGLWKLLATDEQRIRACLEVLGDEQTDRAPLVEAYPSRNDRRERIATAALSGLLSDPERNGTADAFARDAIAHADALIARLDEE